MSHILGFDPAYGKPVQIALLVFGKFEKFMRVPYTYKDQPFAFIEAMRGMFRVAKEYGCDMSLDAKERGGNEVLASIEMPKFMGKNVKTFMDLHETYSVIVTLCHIEEIHRVGFYPNEWRKTFGIKGTKTQVKKQAIALAQSMIPGRHFIGTLAAQEDMAEAFLIGLAATKQKHETVSLPK